MVALSEGSLLRNPIRSHNDELGCEVVMLNAYPHGRKTITSHLVLTVRACLLNTRS